MPASERPTEVVLEIDRLAKRFRMHEIGADILGFEPVSFQVLASQMVALVGASGSGKSSVLKCIYRSYVPTAGHAWYTDAHGQRIDLAAAPELEILRLRSEEIRFVSQFLKVLPRQTSAQIIASQVEGASDEEARARAEETMRHLGLPTRLWDIPPTSFSGGERQLVNLARALVVRPRLLLLDEPTASLDATSTERVLEAIGEMKRPDLAMLGVFHDSRIVDRLSDLTIRMSGGILWDSEPAAAHS
jgi:alpha-D-ribose 1-methylphosphonate 5-triphosphate synthase subunit PhnL